MLKLFTVSIIASLSLIQAATADNVTIAAGVSRGYWNLSYSPFILNKTKDFYWQFNSTVQPPAGFSLHQLKTQMACTKNACLWLGVGFKNTDKNIFIYRTNNNGINWTQIQAINNTPPNFKVEDITNAECFNNDCYITGTMTAAYGFASMLLTSNDAGKSWKFVDVSNLFPMIANQDYWNSFSALNCAGDKCVALGRSRNIDTESTSYRIFNSDDKGVTWNTTPISLELENLYYKNNKFFISAKTLDTNKPIIMMSKDNGHTWLNTAIHGIDDKTNYYLTQLDCRSNICMAAGMSSDKSSIPFTLVSNDEGLNWNLSSNGITFSAGNYSVDFLIATNSTWIMSGMASENGFDIKPYILVSKDDGANWSDVSLSTFLPSSNSNIMSDLKCDDQHCVGVGQYHYSTARAVLVPYIMESIDGGLTWNRSNLMNVPNNIFTANLYNLSG